MTEEEEKNPLWMPKGSVRAILALGIVGSSIYGLLNGQLDPEQFLMISGAVVAFYFATKTTCEN